MAGKKRTEDFKLDNHITWYLKDYEDDVHKKRKLIEKSSGELYYIFGHTLLRGENDGRTLGTSEQGE